MMKTTIQIKLQCLTAVSVEVTHARGAGKFLPDSAAIRYLSDQLVGADQRLMLADQIVKYVDTDRERDIDR